MGESTSRAARIDSVDPRIGTRAPGYTDRGRYREWGFGSICVGPSLPHGSVQPGPDTTFARTGGYDPTYPIRGFSQLHVSGTGGGGTYGDFLLSPQKGRLYVGEDAHDSTKSDEVAQPHYYAVTLNRFDLRAELAVSHFATMYRFHFGRTDQAHLLMNISHSIARDVTHRQDTSAVEGEVRLAEDGVVEGWVRLLNGWGGGEHVAHFAMAFSKTPVVVGTYVEEETSEPSRQVRIEQPHQRVGLYATFESAEDEAILAKVAVSLHSIERAREHLAREMPGWDFGRVVAEGLAAWERALSTIDIDPTSDTQRTIFYTALRNSLLMPRNRTGDHPVWGPDEPFWDDQYCVWDTFRTMFPLLRWIAPDALADNIAGFIARRRHGGRVMDAFIGGVELEYQPSKVEGVPVWYGGMGGDMVDAVIAHAHATDLPGVDWQEAYEVMKFHAEQARCDPYRRDDRGWIPMDDCFNDDGSGIRSPSSFSIEMSFTDYCTADVAEALGHTADAQRYRRRAQKWETLWNPDLEIEGFRGFLSARRTDGTWEDAEAIADNHAFAEGTVWHYSHFVPHNFARMIELHGGPEEYCRRLEHIMEREHVFMDNEPQLLLLHTFHYAGRPDRCSWWVRKHMREEYSLEYYPGPDDSGAMASWYVWGAMGMMPNAGQDVYLLHGPSVRRCVVHMPDGDLTIEAPAASEENIYVQSASRNGRPLDRAWVRHGELTGGVTLSFEMGPEPSQWGCDALPPSPVGGQVS